MIDVSISKSIILLGIGATMVMDLWALVLRHAFGVPSLDYRFVGRWVGHMRHGQFVHRPIMQARPVRGELWLGWGVHFLTGILFAAVLVAAYGVDWLTSPKILPALLLGAGTVVFPFLIMQPCFGFGMAATKTPEPNKARFKSLLTHMSFGVGLYLAGLILAGF